ncbi:PspC domain-containing protein [Serinicoccus profundi]|uniref:PspC domain-containing protein n=1 Tax=Serinicoccus profundi TaxID=1078471 RepID=UPI000255EECD|nr:PspC domain-containing protein [Serinicoccus profundi]
MSRPPSDGTLEDMNENPSAAPATDLPLLPQPRPEQEHGSSALDGVYAALRRLPARRTDDAVLGGICATIADRLGVAPIAVRAAAVLVALLGGVGVGIYLIAWTLMPDRSGRTHLEGGLRHGRGRSLLVLALGTFAALGVLGGGLSFLAAILPELIGLAALAAVGYWVWTRLARRQQREDAAA